MAGPRRYDVSALTDAVAAQWRTLATAAATVTPAEAAAPSSLVDWTVADLLAHVAASVAAVHRSVTGPLPAAPTGGLFDHLAATGAAAAGIAERARSLAVEATPAGLAELLRANADAATAALTATLAHDPGRLAATRLVEAAVHTLDLGRALGRPVAVEPTAMRVAVQALADLLAARAPGPAVEVRIPPYAAVQCVAGPRHTRGTPANVVELATPADWLLLATGRLPWSEALATGSVRASGERADLARLLPLMS
jgi:uncharacterized protein (TIGR03083 family)